MVLFRSGPLFAMTPGRRLFVRRRCGREPAGRGRGIRAPFRLGQPLGQFQKRKGDRFLAPGEDRFGLFARQVSADVQEHALHTRAAVAALILPARGLPRANPWQPRAGIGCHLRREGFDAPNV